MVGIEMMIGSEMMMGIRIGILYRYLVVIEYWGFEFGEKNWRLGIVEIWIEDYQSYLAKCAYAPGYLWEVLSMHKPGLIP